MATSNKFSVTLFSGMNNVTWAPVLGGLPQGLASRVHIFNPDGAASLSVATDTTTSTAGTVLGTEVGPYAIVLNTSDKFKVDVDGAGSPQTVTLTAGATVTAQAIVNEINAQTTGLTATVESSKIRITSNTLGSTSSIEIQAVLHDAYTVLGFSTGTSTGTNNAFLTVLKGAEVLIQISPHRPGFAYKEVICYVKGSGAQPIITQEA